VKEHLEKEANSPAKNPWATHVFPDQSGTMATGKQPLAAGQRLGLYEILELLAIGGMGEIYKARDTRLERVVALKILPMEFTGDMERLKRFQREARAASALNHPHIATVHDIGETEGLHFIVMEYVEGLTLAERIAKGPMETSEVIDISVQICEALEVAHLKGVIHRDIKPANLMSTPEGQVKILDYWKDLCRPGCSGWSLSGHHGTEKNYSRIGKKLFRIINHARLNRYDRRGVMLLDLVSARHIRDYELEIEFEDGAKGIVDFSQYRSRGGVFSKFNDIE